MRRKEKEIKDQTGIEKILTSAIICRVAFHDYPYPYIVPMNYGYDNGNLYFHCAQEGKKIDLIKRNNKVCFEIEMSHEIITSEVSCKWSTKYQSLIGYGEIKIISETEEKKKGLDFIMVQHGKKENLYNENAVKKVGVLKLKITSVTGKQSD